jgi:hypothetical protein
VPAYLVVPKGPGKFAAILWGHWLMLNSSTSSREEFLNEAIALAPWGVVSLLIDAPQARPGFKPAPNPALIAQQVIDMRRGVDLLLSRPNVDSKRIAYVGHSWDAGTGAILDAVDKRIADFVFLSETTLKPSIWDRAPSGPPQKGSSSFTRNHSPNSQESVSARHTRALSSTCFSILFSKVAQPLSCTLLPEIHPVRNRKVA